MPKKLPPKPPRESLGLHRSLSMEKLLSIVRAQMERIPEYRADNIKFSMLDVVMSALAVFSLKFASLLQFENNKEKPRIKHNLRTLFRVINAPSDTTMREVCDHVDPLLLRPAFTEIINKINEEGVLNEHRFLDAYLLSVDGTGHFSSGEVSCPYCCEKHHRNGEVEFYHQMLGAAIVHPKKPQVFPLFPEPITKQDGATKNDCESNAAKRLLPAIHQALPTLNFIVLQDAIGADGPNIKMIKNEGYSFIITVTKTDQVSLYNEVQERFHRGEGEEFERRGADGVLRGYRFINQVPLNQSHPDLLVNFLDYWEEEKGKIAYHHQWVTDIEIAGENAKSIMQAGRARWKVENETFNTLKNLGYNLEHNYGHGERYLSTVFATLMMLAFLIDQVQEQVCELFKAARNMFYSRKALWEAMRAYFRCFKLQSWEQLWMVIIFEDDGEEPATMTNL